MDEEDIKNLFQSLTQGTTKELKGVQEVFSILVKTTLRYRDALLTAEGTILTVEDVRKTLQWLVPALATGEVPLMCNRVQQELLKMWIEELHTGEASGNPQG